MKLSVLALLQFLQTTKILLKCLFFFLLSFENILGKESNKIRQQYITLLKILYFKNSSLCILRISYHIFHKTALSALLIYLLSKVFSKSLQIPEQEQNIILRRHFYETYITRLLTGQHDMQKGKGNSSALMPTYLCYFYEI